MRLLLATLPILAMITEGFGQSLPVTSIASQPFSADEVIIENPKPNVHNVLPMKRIRIYRDSAGRTREDVSIPRDPTATQVVNIEDPIAGIHYFLDTERKIARRLVYPRPTAPVATPTMAASGLPGGLVESFPKFRDVRTTTEFLGTQLIEGLATDGQRITSVSPTSMPGCDENVALSESWYSPELRMTLLQKRSNCMGDGTTRLEHINRAEPDPLLFQVPPDYTIVDQGWSGNAAK
jgi:hypothetical protein